MPNLGFADFHIADMQRFVNQGIQARSFAAMFPIDTDNEPITAQRFSLAQIVSQVGFFDREPLLCFSHWFYSGRQPSP